MIRNDGKYRVYCIQHQWERDGEWVYSAYVNYAKTNSKIDRFDASGRCWQETGIDGVYDIRNARVGLENARKAMRAEYLAPDERSGELHGLPRILPMRIVMIEIQQKTTIMETTSRELAVKLQNKI